MPSKLEAVKFAANVVVGVSTGYCVKEVIKENMTDPDTLTETAKVMVGSGVIAAMVCDQARFYINENIDGIVDNWQKFKAKMEEEKSKKK